MRRIKAQVDRELSGVRVRPELRRSLMAAAERESRRQRRLRSLSVGLGVAGLAAALMLVCGLAMLTRGFHLSPDGAPGDPVQPLSHGQAQQTGAPPLSNPGETPALLLPTQAPAETPAPEQNAKNAQHETAPTEAPTAENIAPAETPAPEQNAENVQDETASTEAPAAENVAPAETPAPEQNAENAQDETAPTEAPTAENEAAMDAPAETPIPEENVAEAEQMNGAAAQDVSTVLYVRLAELNEALGMALEEKQLMQAAADMLAVADSGGDMQSWVTPVGLILTDELCLPADYVESEQLAEEFAAYLSEWQSEPIAEVSDAQAFAYDMDGQVLVQLVLDLPIGEEPPQGVTISLQSPRERAQAGSLQSAVRPDAQADYPVRYQFCCVEQGEQGVRVLCTAILDSVPTDGTTVDVVDGAGEALAQRAPLTIGDAEDVRAFAMGISDSGAYADGVRVDGAADVSVTESAVLLSAPVAVLSVRLTDFRLVCWDDAGSVSRHVSERCPEMPHAPDKTLTPRECDVAGAEPCAACMPVGEAAYGWSGWTVAEGAFADCAVVADSDGARLFGWMPLEEFAGYARQIGGKGTLDMTLAGSRGADAQQYDWLQLSFQNRMPADALRDVQAYEQAAPGYAEFMSLSE